MPPRSRRLPFPDHAVTAVLVSHDGAAWLADCTAGLAAQTRPPQRVVAVDTGVVVVGVDDGRVVVVDRPCPPDDGDVVTAVEEAGSVVVVVVAAPGSLSAGAVVVVVEEVGSGTVVVVVVESGDEGSVAGSVAGSGAGSVAGAEPSVVVVVSVPGPGSTEPVSSASACAAGTHARATNNVVRARPRRTRLSNTRISAGSNDNAVEHIGPHRASVTKRNVPNR